MFAPPAAPNMDNMTVTASIQSMNMKTAAAPPRFPIGKNKNGRTCSITKKSAVSPSQNAFVGDIDPCELASQIISIHMHFAPFCASSLVRNRRTHLPHSTFPCSLSTFHLSSASLISCNFNSASTGVIRSMSTPASTSRIRRVSSSLSSNMLS